MSNRPKPYTRQQQADIGRVVLRMRAAGEPWKEIESLFDRSRWRLRSYAGERMHQNKRRMHQTSDCGDDPPPGSIRGASGAIDDRSGS